MHENAAFDFDARVARRQRHAGGRIPSLPAIAALTNGALRARARLVSQLPLREEAARGLDCTRGPRVAGHVHVRPRRRRRGARAARRRRPRRSTRAALARARSRAGDGAPRRRCRRSTAPPTRTSCAAAAGHTIIAGYPVVHRLGPRHVHRAARPVPRARAASTSRAIDPARVGRRACRDGMLPNRFPDHGESARVQLGRRVAVVRDRRARVPRGRARPTADVRASPARGRDGDPRRLRGAARASASAMDARRPARVRRARRAAHLDGRARSATRCHAAHRQAGRGPGAVDQRAAHAPAAATRAMARRARRRRSARASGTPARGCLYDVVDVDHVPGRVDASVRPNQIFAVGGLPFAVVDGDARARVVDDRRARAADAAGPAHARSPPTRLPPALRRRRRASATAPTTRARSGRGSSARSSRRGCACNGDDDAREARGARSASSRRCSRTSTSPGSATSARSPTATRRTRRAAARSRRGRWAS